VLRRNVKKVKFVMMVRVMLMTDQQVLVLQTRQQLEVVVVVVVVVVVIHHLLHNLHVNLVEERGLQVRLRLHLNHQP
jgi:hypothetical protein